MRKCKKKIWRYRKKLYLCIRLLVLVLLIMWLVNEASHVSGTYLICFREHHSDVSLLFYIHPWYKNHLESQGFPGDPKFWQLYR